MLDICNLNIAQYISLCASNALLNMLNIYNIKNIKTFIFITIKLFQVTEKAGFMFRQYVISNLYDRISTRPFLTAIEKKWLAFQLLCALNQAHQLGVRTIAVMELNARIITEKIEKKREN